MADEHEPLRTLAAARWRIAITLTVTMIVVYFGFIALIVYNREVLSILVAPGLTVGIVLGALVIVVSWLLTFIYVRWANTHYDEQLAEIGRDAARTSRTGASR